MRLPYEPEILLRGIYPKEMTTYIHIKVYTPIFTEFLFMTTPNWKQPR